MTTKNHNKKLIKDLERLFRNEKTPFPVKIKNTIYVGFYGVNQQANKLFKVFSIKNKKILYQTYTKSAAVALAKLHASNYNYNIKDKILELDNNYSKHYLDSIFYKNTLENSNNEQKKDIIETRLDISQSKIQEITDKLNLMVLRNY